MFKMFSLTQKWDPATILAEDGPAINGNKVLIHIPQSSTSEPRHQTVQRHIRRSVHYGAEKSYPSAEMQSAYSTAPVDKVSRLKRLLAANDFCFFIFHCSF